MECGNFEGDVSTIYINFMLTAKKRIKPAVELKFWDVKLFHCWLLFLLHLENILIISSSTKN